MQSAGGTLTPETASLKPAHLIESGPAAGVMACSYLGRLTGRSRLISLDMGGTTAKAAIVEDGRPVRTSEYEVGAGINLSSKLVKGGGHPIKLPFIDVSEIGAGGGSIVSVDPLGSVAVGPVSAGADPGPACYGSGGTEPTLTDALLALGYLDERALGGGAITLDAASGARGAAAGGGGAARPLGRGGGARDPRPLGRDDDARGQGRDDLPGPGPARFRALRVRRQRPAHRGGDRPRAADPAGARPAGSRRLQRTRPPLLRLRARGRADPHAPRRRRRRSSARRGVRRDRGRSRFLLRRQPRHGSDGDEAGRHPLRGPGLRALRACPAGARRRRPPRPGLRGRARPDVRPRCRRRPGRRRLDPSRRPRRAHCLEALRPGCGDPLARAAREHEGGVLRPASTAWSRRRSATAPACWPESVAGRCSWTRSTRPASSLPTASRDSMPTATSRSTSMAETVRATTVDPITLEVVKNALASTADEMALVIMRSAYSPVVRDTMDYSTALCDRTGKVVAQGLTLAVQLGTFPTVMGYVLEQFGSSAQPGDVYIANDPYGCGGQHLPDLYVIKPIFVDGSLEGWAATMAHHSDVGGIAPGSVAVHATEIYQEGLRIPLSKLVDGGVEDETLLRLIEANTRQPIHVLGDLRAQLAACRVGERGLTTLLERYGAEAHVYMDELQRVAERMMRAELAALPDGTHTFTDYIDGVGDSPQPIAIVVAGRDRRRRGRGRLRGHVGPDRCERQLPGRDGARGLLLRHPRDRADRDAELRGLHDADPRPRPRRHSRQPRPAGGLRRPRGDRLPRLRRDHGRARAARAGPRDRRRRGRADADRVGRLRRGAAAVRHDRGPRGKLGSARDPGRARGRLESARQPGQPAGRAARGRPPDQDGALRPRARLGRRRPASRRARVRARPTGSSPTGRH